MENNPIIDLIGSLEISLIEKNEMLIRDCQTKVLELVLKPPPDKYQPLFIFKNPAEIVQESVVKLVI